MNSETDFVAKNDEFITFVDTLAKMALENDVDDMDAFMAPVSYTHLDVYKRQDIDF